MASDKVCRLHETVLEDPTALSESDAGSVSVGVKMQSQKYIIESCLGMSGVLVGSCQQHTFCMVFFLLTVFQVD